MSDLPAAQKHALKSWATQAIEAGWLTQSAQDVLDSVTTAGPAQLFDNDNRPLVAGLFGGTGVGKSTLLNRLAAEPIARTSAERPTSRDVSIYVHRSISVDKLPDAFPMQHLRTALHSNDHYRHVMFIDMPDFDSVESANRKLVDAWLPHLDVVLYVVSPDRYRDDQGWRLLLQHASEHAWLFVMNHWDRGEQVQLDDFRTQLRGAGMSDPLIFRSDSSQATAQMDNSPGSTNPSLPEIKSREDDFEKLQSTLRRLADESTINTLTEHGVLARLKSLKAASDPWLQSINDDAALKALHADWDSWWEKARPDLQSATSLKVAQTAQHFANQKGNWIDRLRGTTQSTPFLPADLNLVDESLLSRLDNTLGDFINQQAQQSRLPLAALKQGVAEPYARVRRDFAGQVNDALRHSLALPGNKWQRVLYRALGWLCVLLPLAAMGWIGWRVVSGFAEGGSNPAAYLGSNFAINGALLLGLAWLLPAFLRRKVKPSLARAAQRGIENGMQSALAQTHSAVSEAFSRISDAAGELSSSYHTLWLSLAQPELTGETDSATAQVIPETVRRMLSSEILNQPERELDVRANTHSSTSSAPVS